MSKDAKHSILIVDDEPDMLFSLKGLLRRDFNLFTAESGQQALQILREHPIHIIMTDQRMPGMTGVELMAQAKTEYPSAIRIVFTGYADIKAVIEAINKGGLYRYLTKPWDPDELIEVLKEAAQRFDRDSSRLRFATEVKTFADEVIQFAESVASAAGDTSNASRLIDRGKSIATQSDVLL
ncbi:MAG: response regulator [Planctomycetota bacterium]|nr:response regulator [Planctomycetota bacterium]